MLNSPSNGTNSFRIGAVTSAASPGVLISSLQQLGRWSPQRSLCIFVLTSNLSYPLNDLSVLG
ncbi:hypothetical protein ATANTOWER_032774, partial [Ataeniobius toweri]|nr:hypothetical protein [Ataeniobius toweri]